MNTQMAFKFAGMLKSQMTLRKNESTRYSTMTKRITDKEIIWKTKRQHGSKGQKSTHCQWPMWGQKYKGWYRGHSNWTECVNILKDLQRGKHEINIKWMVLLMVYLYITWLKAITWRILFVFNVLFARTLSLYNLLEVKLI